jgi:hypothetical protein
VLVIVVFARHALIFCLRMIFSEHRYPSRVKSRTG